MSYKKTIWVEGKTPISADRLNNIENGIEDLYNSSISFSDILSGEGIKASITEDGKIKLDISPEEFNNLVEHPKLTEGSSIKITKIYKGENGSTIDDFYSTSPDTLVITDDILDNTFYYSDAENGIYYNDVVGIKKFYVKDSITKPINLIVEGKIDKIENIDISIEDIVITTIDGKFYIVNNGSTKEINYLRVTKSTPEQKILKIYYENSTNIPKSNGLIINKEFPENDDLIVNFIHEDEEHPLGNTEYYNYSQYFNIWIDNGSPKANSLENYSFDVLSKLKGAEFEVKNISGEDVIINLEFNIGENPINYRYGIPTNTISSLVLNYEEQMWEIHSEEIEIPINPTPVLDGYLVSIDPEYFSPVYTGKDGIIVTENNVIKTDLDYINENIEHPTRSCIGKDGINVEIDPENDKNINFSIDNKYFSTEEGISIDTTDGLKFSIDMDYINRNIEHPTKFCIQGDGIKIQVDENNEKNIVFSIDENYLTNLINRIIEEKGL